MVPIAPVLKDNLLRMATAYADATKTKLATVSRYATNDGNTFGRLRDDPEASITIRKYDDAIAWFAQAPWPKGVKRPTLINPSHHRARRAA